MKNNEIDNRQYENELYSKGYKLIGGIDEVVEDHLLVLLLPLVSYFQKILS